MLTPAERQDLLCVIAERQDAGCAPVTVQIGFVHEGTVQNHGLVITGAPPSVLEALLKRISSDSSGSGVPFSASIGHGGLIIT